MMIDILNSEDVKAQSYTIEALETGFLVSFAYRLKPQVDDKGKTSDYWDYKTKKYAFGAWTDVVSFFGDNQLPQPPK